MPTQDKNKLVLGQQAPLFVLKTQSGQEINLADFKGKKNVLLVFYPGDNTPGCTRQLCALRDDYHQFQNKDTAIFGINHADAKSHQKFIDHYQFPFDLLIDTDKKVSLDYGAIKLFFNKTIIKRSVVLIDKEGKIIYLKRGLPADEEILKKL